MADDINIASPGSSEIAENGELIDETLECRDCGDLFLFTIQEQEYYRDKGLKHNPSRCPTCRKKNREQIQASQVPVRCRRCHKNGFVPEAIPEAVDVLCESCFMQLKQKYLPQPELQSQPPEPAAPWPASAGTFHTNEDPAPISGG